MKAAASGPRYLTRLEITASRLSALCKQRKVCQRCQQHDLHHTSASLSVQQPRAVTKDKLAERRSGSQFELLKPDPHMLLVKLLHMVSHVHVCRARGQTGEINRKHAVSPVNCQRLLVGTSHRFCPQILNLGNLLGEKKNLKSMKRQRGKKTN